MSNDNPSQTSETARDPQATQEDLPPGWQQLVDTDGRAYYADHATRTTTYERPTVGGMQAELPAGWEILRNVHGVTYFVDHNTRTTTFQDPRRT